MSYAETLAANLASIRMNKAAEARYDRRARRQAEARKARIASIAFGFAVASFCTMVVGVVGMCATSSMGAL